MTVAEMARRLDIAWCGGGCGLSEYRHRRGVMFMGVVHYAERRFTRRGAKALLMLVARMRREADPGYLNIAEWDWWYVWHDATEASRLARTLGFVLPARLFDHERELCRLLAARRYVNLSAYPAAYAWSHR